MRAMAYTQQGGSEVLHLVERDAQEPGPGEVRVSVAVAGVNPTDWKARQGTGQQVPEQVPGQDGAGVVTAVGAGSDRVVGQRVWLWEAAWQRTDGTAQESLVLPAEQAVPLPDAGSFDVGASLGIPALTAHRCLTVADGGPTRLGPGALAGRTVLVAGGAGAVGHAAIQLARWSGATVLSTVSGPEKGKLATRAGAHSVIDYRRQDAAGVIAELAPAGVHLVVEVNPSANAALDTAVAAPHAVVAIYANDGGDEMVVPVRQNMAPNTRFQFVLVYTVPREVKLQAVQDVSAAVSAGALPVGEQAGLPLHRFVLEDTGAAHDAVEQGRVGKVLVDVQPL